ncbi:MAG: fibronectin type III domain-containing protein [Oligoflexia bacterium]|nr:fibronectin type III domain-containing protein [Oligoflexia bacterium]
MSTDQVGNNSSCVHLIDFVEHQTGPANLTASQGLTGAINLNWNPDTTANPTPTYIVKRSLVSGGPYTIIASNLTANYFSDSNVSNGATYYYVVAATNNTGTSDNSAEANATVAAAAPGTPISLTLVPGPEQITLSWTAPGTDMFYTIFRGTNTGGPYAQIASGLSTTTYIDKTVTDGTPYYYVVTAINPSGTSVTSNEASAASEGVSNAPTGLTMLPLNSTPACGGNAGIQLFWSAPAYFNQFYVQRGRLPGQESYYATVSGTSYVDCSPNTATSSYIYYSVVATWGNYTSAPSNEVQFYRSQGPAVIAAPGNGYVQLSWNSVGFATYQITRSTSQGGPYTLLATQSGTAYTDSAVTNGVAYYYVVNAYLNGTNNETYPSQEVSAIPGANPTTAPSNLAIAITSNVPNLSWSAPQVYNSFNIYRASSLAGPYSIVGTSNANSYSDSSPQIGMNYYKVTANWGSYETSASNIVSFRDGVPTALTATAGASQITLNWTAVSGASNYSVMRSTTSGGPYTVLSSTASSPYIDSTVVSGTGYFYVVSANFPDSTIGQNSPETAAATGVTTVPVGLSVTGTTNGSVALGWVPISGASGYNVYQSTTSGGPWTLDTAVPTTNHASTVYGLTGATTYYFVVTAIESGVESVNSAQVSAITYSAPAVPLLTAGNGQVSLLWAPVTGATSYTVQHSTDGVTFTTVASGVPTTSYTDSPLTNGQQYFYIVVANFSSGSLASSISPGVTPGITPVAPAGLTITANNNGTDVTLSFAAVPGATSYNIYQSTTSGGPYGSPAQNSAATTGVQMTGLTAGTPYYFTVTALNGTMESTMSSQIGVVPKTTPAAPNAVASMSSVVVSWSAVGGATLYDVQRSGDGTNFITIASALSATTYTDASVTAGSPYIYQYLPYASAALPMAASAPSIVVNPGVQPLNPIGLVAEATSTTSVSLSWVGMPNVSSYNVYRGTVSGGPYSVVGSASASTTYTDATASSGNAYYYVVTSISPSGVESTSSNEAAVNLIPAPTGLAAVSGTNVVNLSWNSVGGASSYVLRREVVGGSYGVIASGITALSYQDTSVQNGVTYNYVVDAVFPSGAISPDSAAASATASQVRNLQVPIELTDESLSSDVSPITFARTQTSLDPTAYDGTVTYFFEAVATNSDSTAHTINLVDAGSSVVGSITVPAGTTAPTRIRFSFVPDATANIYSLSLPATTAAGQVQVLSARVLVNQTSATKTKIYIPLLASNGSPSSGDGASPMETTFSTSYNELASASIYTRNTGAYSTLNSYNAWELETVVAANNGATGSVTLMDLTQYGTVADTEALFGSATPTLIDSPFNEGVSGFGSSNESDQYEIMMNCQTSCTSGSVSLYKAGLWVSLNNLSKAEVIYRDSLGSSNISSPNTLDLERTLVDLTLFSNPTAAFQAVASVTSNTTIELMSDGTQDSGTASLGAVSGSSITFYSSSKTWQRSGTITLTSGNRFLPYVDPAGGSATLVDSAIIVDIGP